MLVMVIEENSQPKTKLCITSVAHKIAVSSANAECSWLHEYERRQL